ncbi:OmpA family protein [Chondrinema litorale]|uniref:OmpA family protein n=1 Tax=Chondrinema litorale TaxID=2994555 RepID=UPI0025431E69|nr:OmpA family protein [Chondrinema litorale]UZR98277.1 OmpA family protein [Chondrinema litorale]
MKQQFAKVFKGTLATNKFLAKIYAIVILLLTVFTTVNAQEASLRKAHTHYNYYEYALAIDYFKKSSSEGRVLTESDNIKLANCYRFTNQPELAGEIYQQLINKSTPNDKSVYYEYGKLLLQLGEYLKAKTILKKYLTFNPDKEEVLEYIRACNASEDLLQNKLKIFVKNESFNSSENDFSPLLLNDTLFFCSSRFEDEKKKYYWDNEAFINIYQLSDSNKSKAFVVPGIINTKMHEGPMAYDSLNQRLYFTRNTNTIVKGNDKEYLLNIYSVEYKNGEWKNLKSFEHNIKGYSTGHPALSTDGNYLYFTSDRPGGIGGTDIYYCKKENDGWSAPKILGKEINTLGKELFPTFSKDGYLYFSSNLHSGLGGLDIFRIKIIGGSARGKVENLGFPFNSNRDDFGLVFKNVKKLSGYFSSNRPGGNGGDDIYFFKESKINIQLVVMDSIEYKKIPDVNLRLVSDQGITEDFASNEEGEILLELQAKQRFIFVFSKDEYVSKRVDFSTQSLNPTTDTLIFIEMRKGVSHKIEGVVFDKDGNNPLKYAKVTMVDLEKNKKEITHTNDSGKFQFNPEIDKNYEIKIDKEDHFVQKMQVSTDSSNFDIKEELVVEKMEVNKILEIENIYYGYDKYEITEEAKVILDKVITIMKDNPTVFIELSSHTDQRGTDDYNYALSKKRSDAAIKYITSKGLDAYRLSFHFYGKSKLAVECPQGDCDEKTHQLNRRTEFKVISY